MEEITIKNDKIFIEEKETLRLIIQQNIGLGKLIDKLSDSYKVNVFQDKDETKIILVEEK